MDDTIIEYQKYKCSETAFGECITHLCEVVSRKSKRMKEAGDEKIYWSKKRDILREMLDSKDPKPGKDDMEMDEDLRKEYVVQSRLKQNVKLIK